MAKNIYALNELHLFAGAGGGILGGILLGHTCVCAVEIEPYRRKVLLQRQRDGILPRFPIWDDIRTFDGKPWRGQVDVVCGGFPCQDISVAGKGAGINGERSGLWGQMARIIGEVRPGFAFMENSPALTVRGLGVVLRDLAEMGYDAKWGVLGAVHAGAPHRRLRIWIVGWNSDAMRCSRNGGSKREVQNENAHTNGICENVANSSGVFSGPGQKSNGSRIEVANSSENMANTNGVTTGRLPIRTTEADSIARDASEDVSNSSKLGQSGPWPHWYASDPAEIGKGETDRAWAERIGHVWGLKSPVGRVANGVAHRVDRLGAIGDGQVPAVVKLAWETLI